MDLPSNPALDLYVPFVPELIEITARTSLNTEILRNTACGHRPAFSYDPPPQPPHVC